MGDRKRRRQAGRCETRLRETGDMETVRRKKGVREKGRKGHRETGDKET